MRYDLRWADPQFRREVLEWDHRLATLCRTISFFPAVIATTPLSVAEARAVVSSGRKDFPFGARLDK